VAECGGSRGSNEGDDVGPGEHSENVQSDERVKGITQVNVDLSPRKITMIGESIPRKNDVHRSKGISRASLDSRTWKVVLQGARGLVTEDSNGKLGVMEECTSEEGILAMNFTETWLEKTMEEGANIEGCDVFGCDGGEERGGVAICLREEVEAETMCEVGHEGCEMVAVSIPELGTINVVVCRPPRAE